MISSSVARSLALALELPRQVREAQFTKQTRRGQQTPREQSALRPSPRCRRGVG